MAKIDLAKFKKPTKSYLQETNSEQKQDVSRQNDQEKPKIKEKRKKAEKLGRPTIDLEPLNSKITVNISDKEQEKIKQKSGGIPLSSYVRKILKEANII